MTATTRRGRRLIARRRVRTGGLLADMLEGVAILDADWRYVYVNPAAARQARMRPGDLIGHRVHELFPGVEQTDIFRRWVECMGTGAPQRFRGSYQFPDGAAWYDFSVRRVEAGIFVLSLDVTDRAAVEAETRRAWETATTALDATPDSVGVYRSVLDEDGRFVDAEIVLMNHTGRRRWFDDAPMEALRGARVFTLRPALRPLIFDLYRQVAEEGRSVREALTFETIDGRQVIDVSVQPFPGGLVHVGRDVSEERASRDALRESEDRLRRIVEGIDGVVTYQEPGTRIPTLSQHVERMLGYPADEVATYRAWEALVHPDDIARCLAAWAHPSGRWDMEYRVRHADGRWVWVADHGSRIDDERGVGAQGLITDISRQRDAAARFQAVFEENPEAIALLRAVRDADGRFVDAEVVEANRAARERHFGGIDAGSATGLRFFTSQIAEAPSALLQAARDACDLGRRWRGELELDTPRGPRRSDISVFPYEYGFAIVGRDVTEQRLAEHAMAAATTRLRHLLDANLFGTLVSEPGGLVVEANDYWLRLVGATHDEVERGEVDWRRLTAPESIAADEHAIAEIRDHGRSAPFEKVYVRHDGTRVPVLVVRTAMPGEGERITSVVLDMSAFREASERAARLAAAVEQTNEGVVITDVDGVITYVNPAFEKASGYSAVEAVGRPIGFLRSDSERASLPDPLTRTLRAGESWRGELVNRRKDGSRYTELTTVSPIQGGDGEVVAFVSVTRDVTVEREAEAQRRQGQRLDALGQLAGGVAHDFNNALAAIRGYAEFVREDLEPTSAARLDMDELLRAVDRAAALTRQLLVFTRRQPVATERIDPSAVISEAVEMLRRLLGEHVELRTSLPRGLGLVLADPAQLEQAVVNLALNARDAMPGGGTLEISVERVAGPGSGAGLGLLRLRVRDNGLGMDEATVARIYEPFFTTKGPGRGTGLGLSMVYGFVQACGGGIRVASQPGEGTAFEIDLPAVDGVAESPSGEHADALLGGAEAILLVEDEPATREVVRRYLLNLGYEPHCAASPAEALERLHAGLRPHLLLTDVRMPGMQGPDLYRAARQTLPHLPVVFMSGFTDAFGSEDMAVDGAAVLDKPFTREALAAALREALDA